MVAIYEYMACINPWKQKAIYTPQLNILNTEQIDSLSLT